MSYICLREKSGCLCHSDLVTDQRVHRLVLRCMIFVYVLLVGAQKAGHISLPTVNYKTHRMTCRPEKESGFYFFSMRLYFFRTAGCQLMLRMILIRYGEYKIATTQKKALVTDTHIFYGSPLSW